MIFHQVKNKNLLACPLGHYCLHTALVRYLGHQEELRVILLSDRLSFFCSLEIEHADKFSVLGMFRCGFGYKCYLTYSCGSMHSSAFLRLGFIGSVQGFCLKLNRLALLFFIALSSCCCP